MKASILPFVKATVAGLGAAIASLISATADGSNAISMNEGLIAAGAFIAVFSATFFIPYSPLTPPSE